MRARSGAKLRPAVALVTGASSGVGRAIASSLARHCREVCIVGRNSAGLTETEVDARRFCRVATFQIDLTAERALGPLLRHFQESVGRLDVLVHCAGVIYQETLENAALEHLDLQYAINVRAPYLLTQRLLPLLAAARGQVVFVNSSLGLDAKRPDIGQYSATKHAAKAIADSLREEVNRKGIRVLTVYLGRTATPMQEALHRQENKVYQPELLLQPEDVASLVVHTLMLPRTAEVTDICIRPMRKLC